MAFSMKAGSSGEPKVGKGEKVQFDPTKEQQDALALAIKHSLLKIQAGAGSGKSSTLFYMAENLPEKSLYLAYNKTMADEAKDKCRKLGLSNVTCMTTHSLAYQVEGKKLHHKLSRPRGRYVNVAGTGTEIAKYFRVPEVKADNGKTVTKNYIGLIIKDTVNRFETSDKDKISEKSIPRSHLKDIEKRYGNNVNIQKLTNLVVRKSKELWEERCDIYSDVLSTHNTYLKLYQLSKPDLSRFSIIYLDEAQDVNPVTYSIVMQQKKHCKIVFVGDEFQSIYAFNNAKNYISTEKCKGTWLTQSFRFGDNIAKIANTVLDYKVELSGTSSIKDSVGDVQSGVIDKTKPYTILYRTNMMLILDALDLLTKGEQLNISIDVKDFIKLLRSCQALYDGDMRNVKHDSIVPFENWDEIEEEAKSCAEVKRVVKLVNERRTDEVCRILTDYRPNSNAKVTLITAHKSKGLEFEQVVLGEDFPSNYNNKGEWVGVTDQERNLLYVACTRAEKRLQINTPVIELIERSGTKTTNFLDQLGYTASHQDDPYVDGSFEPKEVSETHTSFDKVSDSFKKYVSTELEQMMKDLPPAAF